MTQNLNIIAEEISLPGLQKVLKKPGKNQILIDVRSVEEYNHGHIPGAVNMPLDNINQFLPDLAGKDVIVSCQAGKRTSQATEIIHTEGTAKSLKEFEGGFKAWEKAELPIEPAENLKNKNYHPELDAKTVHNGDDTLSKVKTNFGKVAGTVSHQVIDQAKHLEQEFVALSPLRQLYAILGGLMLLAAIMGGVFGVILNLVIALSLIFSSLTGMMFLIDWMNKAPWNKKK